MNMKLPGPLASCAIPGRTGPVSSHQGFLVNLHPPDSTHPRYHRKRNPARLHYGLFAYGSKPFVPPDGVALLPSIRTNPVTSFPTSF